MRQQRHLSGAGTVALSPSDSAFWRLYTRYPQIARVLRTSSATVRSSCVNVGCYGHDFRQASDQAPSSRPRRRK